MKNYLTLIATVLAINFSQAQFIKEKAINAQIGYAISAAYESTADLADDGFFMQGELVLGVASWLELRPYAGLILTSAKGEDLDGNPTDEFTETKAFLIGGKTRVRAPIRWIAPYFEIGLGGSFGRVQTFTDFTDKEKKGMIFHVPVAIGLELGRNNNIDLGFTYFIHPSADQFAGAFAVGVSFPISN